MILKRRLPQVAAAGLTMVLGLSAYAKVEVIDGVQVTFLENGGISFDNPERMTEDEESTNPYVDTRLPYQLAYEMALTQKLNGRSEKCLRRNK